MAAAAQTKFWGESVKISIATYDRVFGSFWLATALPADTDTLCSSSPTGQSG
jgi:hypothetical protein